jgi:hypothetical protein
LRSLCRYFTTNHLALAPPDPEVSFF